MPLLLSRHLMRISSLVVCVVMSLCLLHISVPRWHFLVTLGLSWSASYMTVVRWLYHRVLFFRNFLLVLLGSLLLVTSISAISVWRPFCVLVVGAASSFSFEL